MSYEVLKAEYVFQTLAKGDKVIACDFATMTMKNCEDLTVKQINSYIEKGTAVVFYKAVSNE